MRVCPTCSRTYADDIQFCPLDGGRLKTVEVGTEAQLAAGLSRRFRIVRRLGAGGMGAVYLAEQISVGNRRVALKVLSRKLLDDPEFLDRFHNEAASTGRIDDPNVVTIYESGQADDGTPYIAMKYLEGETLRQALRKRGALPLAECAEILQQVASGLDAAHKLGIIHRDLKPDNIFLTRRDGGKLTVTVVDFGIAKLRESATHTLTGTVLGTPAYMSCEQASGMKSDELDARSDIYSLGVVVYEMLTGRVPFQSDTPVGYLRKHLQDAPPPFRAVRPDLPTLPEVEKVVMKALAKDRERRYASVLEFTGEFVRAVSAPALTGELQPTVKVVEPPAAREPEQEGPPMKRKEVLRRKEENAEAEVPSARPSPPEPRRKRTLVTPPPSTPPVGTVPKEKTSRLGMAIFAATVLVAILATVTWRYWGGSAQLPGTPRQRTSAPAQPQTPALAPVSDNPPALPPTPPSGATQILVRTSPDAQVYLDDTFKGTASALGRLVIDNPQPGKHALRISLAGKKDYELSVNVVAGQMASVHAPLADVPNPQIPAPAAPPTRAQVSTTDTSHRLTEQQVLDLLRGGVPPSQVGQLVQQRGINFKVTPEVEREVEQAIGSQGGVQGDIENGLARTSLLRTLHQAEASGKWDDFINH